MKTNLLSTLTVLGGIFLFSGMTQAQDAQDNNKDVYVPAVLEPWVDWVLEQHPQIHCPKTFDNGTRLDCGWIREIDIHLLTSSSPILQIRMNVDAFADTQVSLPVAASIKPRNVLADGNRVPVMGGNNQPMVFLTKGAHIVTLELTWDPELTLEYVDLPSAGIVNFRIDDEPIAQPVLTNHGTKLWLTQVLEKPSEPSAEADMEDTQKIRVFRSLEDSVPQMLVSYVQLTVTGRSRLITLGEVLPAGFLATNLESSRPALLDESGKVTLAVEVGNNWVQIEARAVEQFNRFSYRKVSEDWPTEEVWMVEPNPAIRVISMAGPPRTNLDQIDIPARIAHRLDEKTGFVLSADADLVFTEGQRGDVNPRPTDYYVERELWLNFAGESFIAEDTFYLDAVDSEPLISKYLPGSVKVDGEFRLLTFHDPDQERLPGVTVSEDISEIEAVTQFEKSNTIPAIGWDIEAQGLNMTMHLPPGWMMLWSQGSDRVQNSWVSHWSVASIFLALLLLILVFRLGGTLWTTVLAITILSSFPYSFEPMIGWIVLASLGLLLRLVRSNIVQKILRVCYGVVLIVVSLMTIYTAASLARDSVYPHLSQTQHYSLIKTVSAELQRSMSDAGGTGITLSRESFVHISPLQILTPDEASQGLTTLEARMQLSDIEMEEMQYTGARLPGPQARPPITRAVNVQTGPGTPYWQHNAVQFDWDGSVSANQNLNFVLLPPWVTRIVIGIAAILMGVVALFFLLVHLPQTIAQLPNLVKRVVSIVPCILLVSLMLNTSNDLHADIPDSNLLADLEDRLLDAMECKGDCAYVEQATVTTKNDQMTMVLRIHTLNRVAVPLPTSEDTWQLKEISAGEVDLPLLRKRARLYTVLDKGVHDVTVIANTSNLHRLDFRFPLLPSYITLNTEGWLAEGISHNQLRQQSFSLQKTIHDTDTDDETNLLMDSSQFVSPYVSVTRRIYLEYEPRMETIVERIAPQTGEFTVRIPLLQNESVLEHSDLIESREMVINFDSRQSLFTWESQFNALIDLQLQAPLLSERSEVWSILTSEFWLLDFAGITPIQSDSRLTTFVPLSGEILDLKFSQPSRVPSNTLTVEIAHLAMGVNERATETILYLSIQATQASEFSVSIPENASIKDIRANNDQQPIPPSSTILLPITNGLGNYQIEWVTDSGVDILEQTPTITLNQQSVNVSYTVSVPQNRWVIWTGGLAQNPDVLTWLTAVGLIVLGLCLVRVPNIGLSVVEVILLAIGSALTNPWIFIAIGVWKLAVWWRSHNQQDSKYKVLFYVIQSIFVLLGVIFGVVVIYLIIDVLVAASGGNIFHNNFSWYVDEIGESLPVVWLLVLPQWSYLALIVIWLLWFAVMFVRWARRSWSVVANFEFQAKRLPPVPATDS